MGTSAYRTPESCATCGTAIVVADAYLSRDGPVCEECHRADAAAARGRDRARESNTEALLGGIFSTLAGVTLLATGLLFPEIQVRACVIAVAVLVGMVIRVPRMETTEAHGAAGKWLVVLGAILGAIGVVAILVRFAG
jgi:hypothetical protein